MKVKELRLLKRLNLRIVEKGTHILPVSEWNNDVPSPCECVADALADFEYHIEQLIKSGGAMNDSAGYGKARASLLGLNLALNSASKQGWKLELEECP